MRKIDQVAMSNYERLIKEALDHFMDFDKIRKFILFSPSLP